MLRIREVCYQLMVQDAFSRLPKEACGILSGKGEVAESFFAMKNTDDSPVSYLMDPKEQFHVMKHIREREEEMLVIYHSHVASPAVPSAKDVQLAFYPNVYYLLISLADRTHPVAKAYRIREGKVTEHPFETVPQGSS